MNQNFEHFKAFAPTLKLICDAYPAPSRFKTSKSAAYTRQQLKLAIELYLQNPTWRSQTDVPFETVSLIHRNFIVSDEDREHIYVGPKRNRKNASFLAQAPEHNGPSSSPSIPPINCSDPAVLNSLFFLKNLDLLPFPIPVTHIADPLSLETLFPNTSLVATQNPGEFTLL